MRMKETPRSLSIFLVVVGIWGLLGNLGGMADADGNIILILLLLTGFVMSGAFLYLGFSLRSNLVKSSRQIIRVLYASMIYFGILFALSLFGGDLAEAIAVSARLLIVWYVSRNVRRLSVELVADKGGANH